MNEWVKDTGDVIPSDWETPGLPVDGDWTNACGCESFNKPVNSTVDTIRITGKPGTITSVEGGLSKWALVLNDTPDDFRIDRFDDSGALADSPLTIARADGVATFHDPLMLSRDPVEDMEAATKAYTDSKAGIPDAPAINWYYGRFNSAWAVIPIQSDAPSDGQAYVRQNNAWSLAFTGSGYLPLTGGTISGNLTVSGIMTVSGPNSFVLNAPNGQQRAILGQTSGLTRWQMQLGDQTSEGTGNSGSNFSLSAYALTGSPLGTWLSIARSDGSTVFNGSGVTIQGGLAVNGLLALASLNNLAIYGGSAGQVITTNGSGILTWTTPSGGGGPSGPPVTISDTAPSAPSVGALWWDSVGGQLYVWYQDANSSQWVPTTNAASLPPPASTTVLGVVKVDGTTITAAADGTITASASGAIGDNRIINGDMRINQRSIASGATAVGYTLDRWKYDTTQVGKLTYRQGGFLPNSVGGAVGFGTSMVFSVASSFTPGATDKFAFSQPIEADMISDFAWGAPTGQAVTLSFFAMTTGASGTYSGAIKNSSGTRSYHFIFNLVSFVWTKIAITIPPDTTGPTTNWVLAGSSAGVVVAFDLGMGSNFRGPANTWAGADYWGATGAVSFVSAASGNFNFTGVKLEIGSAATPFNRQSLAKSMADCQRYYTQTGGGATAPDSFPGTGYAVTATLAIIIMPLQVRMRAKPTFTFSSAPGLNVSSPATGAIACTAASLGGSSFDLARINLTVASGLVAGQGCSWLPNNSATDWIGLSAEL